MSVTFSITFIFDTSVGLAVGIGCSMIVYLIETTFSSITAPFLLSAAKDNDGIDVVKLEGDLTFLSAARVKDFVTGLTVMAPKVAELSEGRSEYLFQKITGAFDAALKPHLLDGVGELPKALIIDMSLVRLIDLTGTQALAEVTEDARNKGILVAITNAHERIQIALAKMGVQNDGSTSEVNIDRYINHKGASLLPVTSSAASLAKLAAVDAEAILTLSATMPEKAMEGRGSSANASVVGVDISDTMTDEDAHGNGNKESKDFKV
jgi:MFS superfamily sulfate permease-like transporter